MGCGNSKTLNENQILQQRKIKLEINNDNDNDELIHVQKVINLITSIRNKIIYKYHHLIYKSGACIFLHPSISLCVKCIFYKISADFKGFEKAKIVYNEDPPYIKTNLGVYPKYSKMILSDLFDFIIDLNSYNTLFKKIDKDSAELLYIVFEKKGNISKKNISYINEAMIFFKQISILRENILKDYKKEIYSYIQQPDYYIQNIDYIGLDAVENNITDIYEIIMLKKGQISEFDDPNFKMNEMYNSIDEAKNKWEKIIDKEYNEEITFSS